MKTDFLIFLYYDCNNYLHKYNYGLYVLYFQVLMIENKMGIKHNPKKVEFFYFNTQFHQN